jgi:hypothetical protein
MKVELHLHTDRYSACAVLSPAAMMHGLIERKYEAVYITEHEAVWSEREIADLQQRFPEIKIFPGVELTLVDYSVHLVVLGTTDREYVTLQKDPEAVLEKARDDGCLTVLAHPFRWPGSGGLLEEGFRPDALELRTGNHNAEQAQLSEEFAERFSLATVNAGDIHHADWMGRQWVETHRPIAHAKDIREIVLAGEYDNVLDHLVE